VGLGSPAVLVDQPTAPSGTAVSTPASSVRKLYFVEAPPASSESPVAYSLRFVNVFGGGSSNVSALSHSATAVISKTEGMEVTGKRKSEGEAGLGLVTIAPEDIGVIVCRAKVGQYGKVCYERCQEGKIGCGVKSYEVVNIKLV